MMKGVNCGVENGKKFLAVLNVLSWYFLHFAPSTSHLSFIDKPLALAA